MTELLPDSVLRKTEAGVAAIKERDRALAQKSRTLLILVDGAKSVRELARFSNDPEQATQWLNELLSAGLVSAVAPPPKLKPVAAPAPTAAAPTPAANTAGQAPRDLKLAIRNATRLMEDLLGPTCEPLCLQLEKCKSFDEFSAKIHDFRRIVASMRSEKKADEFVASALRP